VVWKNEGVAGIIFIFWWLVMWYLAFFIAVHNRGAGVGMGLPLFLLGILSIISWHRKKVRETSSSATESGSKTPGQ